MAYYACKDCHQKFTATSPTSRKVSHAETQEEIKSSKAIAPKAKFCPFCGSLDIMEEKRGHSKR